VLIIEVKRPRFVTPVNRTFSLQYVNKCMRTELLQKRSVCVMRCYENEIQ
jgi:hypothetical protein